VLAPGRAERPDAFAAVPVPPSSGPSECPFCEGREDRTPPEVAAVRPGGGAPDSPGWVTRVVPNLYPVLGGGEQTGGSPDSGFTSPDDPLGAPARVGEPDLFASSPAVGAHEVIVNAPPHVSAMTELNGDAFASAVEAWRERIRSHADAAYCHLIVNEGPAAGASLDHSHAQLYALDFVPTAVARERERFAAYHERTEGAHLLEDVAAEEVRRSERLVAIDDEAVLVAPWASRSPFELRVIPRRPAPRFEDPGAGGTGMLHRALGALRDVFGDPPQLNLWVRTAPLGTEEFHWHIDIVPRLTVRAGFEMGTGIEVNVYPPERAAEDLRRVMA
jgi:UDPglucose--hexose-1-phosphate uridylyltransferase